MRQSRALFLIMACLCACPLRCWGADEEPKLDIQNLPGVGPLPTEPVSMSEDQLVSYFEGLKKGTPVELTLDKGKVVKGIFSSYDDYYGMVWLVPQGDQGILSQKGFKLSGIRGVKAWDKRESASLEQMGSSDYHLLKEMDDK
jgi:hypothetical protein